MFVDPLSGISPQTFRFSAEPVRNQSQDALWSSEEDRLLNRNIISTQYVLIDRLAHLCEQPPGNACCQPGSTSSIPNLSQYEAVGPLDFPEAVRFGAAVVTAGEPC